MSGEPDNPRSEPAAPHQPARRPWKRWLRLVVAALLLAVLFTQVPIEQVAASLRGVSAGPVGVALLCVAGLQAVWAMRLRRLASVNGLTLSLPRIVEINLTARFYALFVPGGNVAGTAIRFARLAGRENNPAGVALALGVDRLLATLSLGLTGLAFLLWVNPPGSGGWWVALLVVTTGGAALMLPALIGLRRVKPFVRSLGSEWLRDRLPGFGRKIIDNAADAAKQTQRIPPTRLSEGLGWSVLAHALGATAYWQLALALGLGFDYATGGWVRAAMLTVTLLPISFAGIGLREGAAVLALGALGVAPDEAVAFGLLCFVVTVVGPGVFGGALEAAHWCRPGVASREHRRVGNLENAGSC